MVALDNLAQSGLTSRVPATPEARARNLLTQFQSRAPRFHLDGQQDWSVSRATIEFLAHHVPEGGVTLETGAGLSSVLFAGIASRHYCICPDAGELRRIQDFCRDLDIPTAGLELITALSEDVLPALQPPPLDLVLIDGGHGFPMPIIDWYYTASKLKVGGVLVIDDTHLWSSAVLVDFLRHDPAWKPMGRVGRRTFAFRKIAPVAYQEFCFQPYVVQRSRLASLVTRALTAWDLVISGDIREFGRRGLKLIRG